jgi:hypothetical protein
MLEVSTGAEDDIFLSPAMLMKDMTQIIPSPAWLGDKLGMNLAVPAQTATDCNPIALSYGPMGTIFKNGKSSCLSSRNGKSSISIAMLNNQRVRVEFSSQEPSLGLHNPDVSVSHLLFSESLQVGHQNSCFAGLMASLRYVWVNYNISPT